MKIVGALLLALIFAFIAYVGYHFFSENNRTLTPIPDEKGVKVIFVTPGQ